MIRPGKEIALAVRSTLAERIGATQVDLWFGDVELAVREGRLCVFAGTAFRAERLRRSFGSVLQAIGYELLGPNTLVEFVGSPPDTTDQEASTMALPGQRHARRKPPEADQVVAGVHQRSQPPDRRLCHGRTAEFVVGEEHRMLMASVDVVLAQPGKVTPLYIYGPTGCGKTEFLGMVRRAAMQRSGLRRIVSVSAEQFTTEFLDALDGKGLPLFRRKFRDVEMLLIDDLQFFSGKKQTLVELQNTIDAMLRAARPLVLAADRPPNELEGFNPVLVGRLHGGLVCRLPYPGTATRRQIARRLAEQHGGLSESLIELVAGRFDGDARQVLGAVYRLIALRKALQREPTLHEAQESLSDLLRETYRVVRLVDIQSAVCQVFGLEPHELQAESRCKTTRHPRMLAMWLARKYTRAGLSEICRYFGRRSHSTVVSAHRQVEQWLNCGATVRVGHGELPVEDAIRRIEMQLRTA